MKENSFVSADDIRSAFSAAMSLMYREEVPAYGTLMELVARVNGETLSADATLKGRLEATDSLERISEERHGAIRLGTPAELSMMRRVFAVMGMYPVGYYDLSTAGVPVHSTAFRPVGDAALKHNPFRVFTSLLRLDLISDEALRAEAEAILKERRIFTSGAVELTEKAERDGGLDKADAERFVAEVLETFRWHDEANVSAGMYERLHDAHRLIADVVSFKGPHINHLTPRTLDIDRVQAADAGIWHCPEGRRRRTADTQMPGPASPDVLQGARRAGFLPRLRRQLEDRLAYRPLRRDRAARHRFDA